MAARTFSPDQIVTVFAGVRIDGYAGGTFVTAEENEDTFSTDVGATGNVLRIRNLNDTGTVTITLQQDSPSNDVLTNLYEIDRSSNAGSGSLLIKHLNGSTVVEAEQAWVSKAPSISYGTDANNVEWTIHCADLRVAPGSIS